MSKSFLTDKGLHIEEGREKGSGNVAFASPSSVQNLTISRRDDLYSLFLMLIYLRTGVIPGVEKCGPRPSTEEFVAEKLKMNPQV